MLKESHHVCEIVHPNSLQTDPMIILDFKDEEKTSSAPLKEKDKNFIILHK